MPDASAPGVHARALALPGVGRVADLPGVHLVGGAVRDLRRGRRPDDLDLVVEGDLGPVLDRLPGPTVAHERFGTATVRLGDARVDVSRSRAERYGRPGALPEVVPAPIAEDLLRRDFTVNTFALELASGVERAVPGAEEDLAAGVLRVLHPRSFVDDPTRLLRLARYAARLGFAPDATTREQARRAVAAGAVATATGERVGAELRLLAREDAAIEAFAVLRELGIDEAIAPGFGLRDPAGAEAALALLPPDGRRDVVLLAGAAREVADPSALLRRLGFRAGEARAVELALDPPDVAGRGPGEVGERLSAPEQAAWAGALGAGPEARRWLEEGRHVGLEVTGDDLRAAGVPEGRELGRILRTLRRRKRDGELAGGREAEIRAALAALEERP